MIHGPCAVAKCENPSRLYPSGWWCAPHAPQPVNPTPDPALTLDGLRLAAGIDLNTYPWCPPLRRSGGTP